MTSSMPSGSSFTTEATITLAEAEPMANVCNEVTFLKCTNKTKKQCENAINLTIAYCGKKLELDKTIDWDNKRELMKTHAACINASLESYFDGESENLYACYAKTDYMKRLEKFTKELSKNMEENRVSNDR